VLWDASDADRHDYPLTIPDERGRSKPGSYAKISELPAPDRKMIDDRYGSLSLDPSNLKSSTASSPTTEA
jgi:hypothetical protein